MEKTHPRRARKLYAPRPRKPAAALPPPPEAPYLSQEVPPDLAAIDLSPLLRYALCPGGLDFFYDALVSRTALPGMNLRESLDASNEETYKLLAHCLEAGVLWLALGDAHWRQSPHFQQWKRHPIAAQYGRE